MTKKKELAKHLNSASELSKEIKSMALDVILSAHDRKIGKELEIMAFDIALRAHVLEVNIIKAKSLTEKRNREGLDKDQEQAIKEYPNELCANENGLGALGALFG